MEHAETINKDEIGCLPFNDTNRRKCHSVFLAIK